MIIPFPDKQYDIIYCDPPWTYHRGAINDGDKICSDVRWYYDTMEPEDIAALPVNTITKDKCILFMWATGPHMRVAMDIIEAWGFTYKQVFKVWEKGRGNPGSYSHTSVEFVLVATKGGRPYKPNLKNVHQFLFQPRGEHSRKPEVVRTDIDRMYPHGDRIELFARQAPKGWDVWGNQTDKFDTREELLEYGCDA